MHRPICVDAIPNVKQYENTCTDFGLHSQSCLQYTILTNFRVQFDFGAGVFLVEELFQLFIFLVCDQRIMLGAL